LGHLSGDWDDTRFGFSERFGGRCTEAVEELDPPGRLLERHAARRRGERKWEDPRGTPPRALRPREQRVGSSEEWTGEDDRIEMPGREEGNQASKVAPRANRRSPPETGGRRPLSPRTPERGARDGIFKKTAIFGTRAGARAGEGP